MTTVSSRSFLVLKIAAVVAAPAAALATATRARVLNGMKLFQFATDRVCGQIISTLSVVRTTAPRTSRCGVGTVRRLQEVVPEVIWRHAKSCSPFKVANVQHCPRSPIFSFQVSDCSG